jgi:hypothetical protein
MSTSPPSIPKTPERVEVRRTESTTVVRSMGPVCAAAIDKFRESKYYDIFQVRI